MKLLTKRILIAFDIIALILGATAVYSYFVEPARLVVHEETVEIPHWSARLDGFKVVAISDLHGGSNYITEEKIRRVVETANAQTPDLIVLLGDYVSQKHGKNSDLKMPVETIAANLHGLRAKYGVYAVIGNHDWWFDEKRVRARFEAVGIKVLENETVSFPVGEETVNVWGIEDNWKNRRVPLEAFERLASKENTIAITHNPDSLLKAPAEIALMFAGHTHGGQFRFPVYGALALVNDPRFMEGLCTVDGKNVFVTTGIGTSGPAFRFRVPPEIAVLTLSAE